MNLSIAGYKRLGGFLYYAVIGGAALADHMYQVDGIFMRIGRFGALFFLVLTAVVSTSQKGFAEIEAELLGPADPSMAERFWRGGEKLVIWGSLAAAAWFGLHMRIWDCLVALGLPAWQGWLRVEHRRLRIKAGQMKPAAVWYWLTAAFALSAAAFGLLCVFYGFGPAFPLAGDEFHMYPAGLIISLVLLLPSGIGTGGRPPDIPLL